MLALHGDSMSEPWEISLYPIVKKHMEDNILEEYVSDGQINRINNLICQEFHDKYIITKRSEA